jgi:hypothetical protein
MEKRQMSHGIEKEMFGIPYHIGTPINEWQELQEILSSLDLESMVHTKDNYAPVDNWHNDVKTTHGTNVDINSEWVTQVFVSLYQNIIQYIGTLTTGNSKYTINSSTPYINIVEKGQTIGHHMHSKGGNVFSYTYFHKLPKDSGQFYFVNRNADYQNFGQDKQEVALVVEPRLFPKIKEGTVLVYPSWLEHGTTIHNSNEPKITVNGTIKFEI